MCHTEEFALSYRQWKPLQVLSQGQRDQTCVWNVTLVEDREWVGQTGVGRPIKRPII